MQPEPRLTEAIDYHRERMLRVQHGQDVIDYAPNLTPEQAMRFVRQCFEITNNGGAWVSVMDGAEDPDDLDGLGGFLVDYSHRGVMCMLAEGYEDTDPDMAERIRQDIRWNDENRQARHRSTAAEDEAEADDV